MMESTRELARLRGRLGDLERVCAEAYQFAGAVGAPVRVLDTLQAAAQGRPIPRASFLPVAAEECDAVAQRQAALERVREAVGGGQVSGASPAAVVLGRRGGHVRSPAKAAAARRNAKLGGRPRRGRVPAA